MSRTKEPRYTVIIVRRQKGWIPTGLLDVPCGRIVTIAEHDVLPDYARNYNQCSLDEAGDTWAVLVRNMVRML
jgi:hypothetical protein